VKARTPYLKLLSASTMALLVIVIAGYLLGERASAQRLPPPPGDPVLAAVQDVQRSIAGLQVNVDALQQGLDAQLAPMAVKSRWTPAVRALNDDVICMVVNISDVEKSIHIEVKADDGSTRKDEVVNVAPGATNLVVTRVPNFGFYCKFTVINGTRADIRGTLLGLGINGGHSFEVPAE
jgi:hypothetical protein